MKIAGLVLAALSVAGAAQLGSFIPHAAAQDTDDTRALVQRACGACHSIDIVFASKKSKDEWASSVSDMISKGAQVSPAEFGRIVDYLGSYVPPAQPPARAQGARDQGAAPQPAAAEGPGAPAVRTAGAGRPGGPGPVDEQVVDPVSAGRGRSLYIAECVTCHGADSRGGGDEGPPALRGPDLIRSVVVAHDRYGSALGPFLRSDHPMQSGKTGADLAQQDIVDLSNFLHKQVDDTLSGGAYTHILNVLTGDPKAGEAFFFGPGNCTKCHSPTGDLAGIAKRYDPPALQQEFVFPRTITRDNLGKVTTPKPTTITVVLPNGTSVSGELKHLDDFTVSLQDSSGNYRAWRRTADMKIEKNDPYAAHVSLLDTLSDKNIHDVVAYLETLQ